MSASDLFSDFWIVRVDLSTLAREKGEVMKRTIACYLFMTAALISLVIGWYRVAQHNRRAKTYQEPPQ